MRENRYYNSAENSTSSLLLLYLPCAREKETFNELQCILYTSLLLIKAISRSPRRLSRYLLRNIYRRKATLYYLYYNVQNHHRNILIPTLLWRLAADPRCRLNISVFYIYSILYRRCLRTITPLSDCFKRTHDERRITALTSKLIVTLRIVGNSSHLPKDDSLWIMAKKTLLRCVDVFVAL